MCVRIGLFVFYSDRAPQDPRKVVYLLNYMLEIRRATTAREGVSLDEARLMFWLEVQVLFEMSGVMMPSRHDMSKVYDKFFRQGSGFYVRELAEQKQVRVPMFGGIGGWLSGGFFMWLRPDKIAAKFA